MDIKDQLSWEDFKKNFRISKIKKALPFNRMVFSTDNFFVIAGYGAFAKGYVLVITKRLEPSFAHISKKEHRELCTILEDLKKKIKKNFNSDIALFEHGMCSCVGGLDRAHLHVMPIPINISKRDIVESINISLKSRKIGIKHIIFNNKTFSKTDDIDVLYELFQKNNSKKVSMKVIGNIYDSKYLKKYNHELWPMSLEKAGLQNKPYIFFKTQHYAFLTDINIQTQFGREIIYNLKLKKEKLFRDQCEELKKQNSILNPWRWQESLFEKNIIDTVNILRSDDEN